jgi:hypothetical protein
LDIGGLGVKPFHIISVIMIVIIFIFSRGRVSKFFLYSPAMCFFSIFLSVVSVFQIIANGVTPGFLRGVFYAFIFLFSMMVHAEILKQCLKDGIDFNEYISRAVGLASLIVVFIVSVKNFIYLPDVLSQYFAGALRPKPSWNFMNYGESINNEIVFSIMLLPMAFMFGKNIFYYFSVFVVLIYCVLTKVDAAYLFFAFFLMIHTFDRFFESGRKMYVYLLFLLFIIPLVLEIYFVSGYHDELSGGELGRYLLWREAYLKLLEFPIFDVLFGGFDISYMISGFDEFHKIGHHVMDFHNTYLNFIFEFGLFVLCVYLMLFFLPLLNVISLCDKKHPVVIYLLFSLLSCWFSPRGMDYSFWFLVPFVIFMSNYSRSRVRC